MNAGTPLSRPDDDRSSSRPDARSRRAVLALAGAGLATGLAGCLGGSNGDGDGTDDGSGDGDGDGDGTSTGTDTNTPYPTVDVSYRGRFQRVGLAPAVNDAGVELGTWADDGLNVTYVTASGAQAAAKSVASGKDMFGNGGIAAVLQLIESGAPLTVIGQIAGPMGGVVSMADTGIEDWTDLEGKTIGVFPFGSTGPAAKAAMRRKDVDLSTITFQNIQPGAGQKLLLSGKLDGVVRYFPQILTRLEAQGEQARALKTADVLGHLGVTLYTRTKVVEKHPGRVERFVKGWLEAFEPWVTNVDKVIELYEPKAVGEFDPELERKTLPSLYASQAPPKETGLEHGKGWTPADRLQDTIDIFTEAGMLEGSVKPEDVYTNEFVERNHDLAVDTAELLYDRMEDFDVGPDYV
jgi:NitT/TauT family transport system substrate-binding protein